MGKLDPNSKSEMVVRLRDSGKGLSWRQIAEKVGSTESSCRVLYHKRRWYRSQSLAQVEDDGQCE
jgi:hypothetical protein